MPIPTRRQIRASLETVINNYATTNSLAIAFENVKFTPPDTVYLSCKLLPSRDRNISMCYGNSNPAGVFQIDINGGVGEGVGAIEALAADIIALYPEGSRVGSVRIALPAWQNIGQPANDGYVLSISIFYSYI